MPNFFTKKSDRLNIVLLVVLWGIIELLVNPAGEFPLNDDWSYSRSLLHLYKTGEIKLTGFTSMPLVAQLYWALAFCKVFGFSFTVVRCATIVLGAVALIFTYLLARKFTTHKYVPLACAVLLLVNPVFFNLSNTFMTDIPFLAFLLAGLFFGVSGLEREKALPLLMALLFFTCATMVRQLGLLAAFSLSVALLMKRRDFQRTLYALLIFVVPLSVYLMYGWWLKDNGTYPSMYDEGTKQIRYHLLGSDYPAMLFLLKQVINVLVYTGFFVFPLLVILNLRSWVKRPAAWLCLLAGLGMVGAYLIVYGAWMPYTGNVMHHYGLGTIAVRDIMVLKLPHLERVPGVVWVMITLMGGVGAGVILLAGGGLLTKLTARKKSADATVVFLFLFAVLYSAVMVVGGSFDRYLLPLLPVMSCLLLFWNKYPSPAVVQPKINIVFIFLVVVYGMYSIGFTHDYLSWNRARWKALSFLKDDAHIAPEKIDGGFEFNGFYLYDDSRMELQEDPEKKSWWWVKDDEYMVTFGPVNNYQIIAEYPYKRFFFAPEGKIFVLKRNPPGAGL